MSLLKPGTLCIIVGGCPENIGLIVEVIEHLGIYGDREDAYYVRTVTNRPFHQVWSGNDLLRGCFNECITDRHKLRPLVDPKDDDEADDSAVKRTEELVVG